jgi:ataxin-3
LKKFLKLNGFTRPPLQPTTHRATPGATDRKFQWKFFQAAMNARGLHDAEEGTIYWERQEGGSLLCGEHCLNNLLQGSYFNSVQLSEMALVLDKEESKLTGSQGYSQNVDPEGNFSVQVLRAALLNFGEIELFSPSSEDMRKEGKDWTKEEGFVVNRSSHWYSIRKLDGKWWDLNSLAHAPQSISDFHLGGVLTQLESSGATVFIARGKMPAVQSDMQHPNWHSIAELRAMADGETGSSDTSSRPSLVPFSGRGNRLGDTSEPESIDDEALAAIAASLDDPEDLEMARALAMSMQSESARAQANTSEEAPVKPLTDREKRLAALEKRGIS